MKSATIICLPTECSDIEQTIEEFSKRGLVDLPILVPAESDSEATLARITSTVAETQLDQIRLVALRSRDHPSEDTLSFEKTLERKLRLQCSSYGVGFLAGVIAEASDSQPSENGFHFGWDFNLILVPEDSTGEDRFIPASLDPAHSGAALVASVGLTCGLFSFLDSAVLDGWREGVADNALRVRLARWHLRVVDATDVVAGVVGNALDPGGVWPLPDNCISHPDEAALIANLAPDVIDRLGFTFAAAPTRPAPTLRKLSIWAALTLFFGKFLGYQRASTTDFVEQVGVEIRARLAKAVQGATFGTDSQIYVTARGTEQIVPLSTNVRIDGLAAYGAVIPAPVPQPAVWIGLRSLALGLADGGRPVEPLDGLEQEHQHKRVVLTNRSLVTPPLDTTSDGGLGEFVLNDAEISLLNQREGACLRRFDAFGAQALSDAFAQILGDPQPDEHNAYEDSLISDRSTEPDDDRVDVEDDEDVPDAKLKTARAGLRRLRTWREERNGSLLWTLAEALSSATTDALRQCGRAQEEWDGLQAEFDASIVAEHKSRRRLRWAGYALVGLGVLILMGLAGALLSADSNAAAVSITTIVVWLIAGSLVIAASTRAQVRAEFRLHRLTQRPDEIMSARQHAVDESARLSYLSDQLDDWAEIIAVTLHQPYGARSTAEPLPVMMEDHPLRCLAFGSPASSPDSRIGAALAIRQEVVTSGWLNRAFDSYTNLVQLRQTHLTHTEEAPFEADATTNDVGMTAPGTDDTISSPRRQLRDEVLDRRHGETLRAALVQSHSVIPPAKLAALLTSVESAIEDLDQSTPERFLSPMADPDFHPRFSHEYLERGQYRPDECEVAKTWQAVSAPYADGHSNSVELSAVPGRSLLVGLRLELSQAFFPSQVALIHHVEQPAAAATSDLAHIGDVG